MIFASSVVRDGTRLYPSGRRLSILLMALDVPSTSPKFTGTLVLHDEHPFLTRALLCLPDGLRFSEIIALRPVEDVEDGVGVKVF